MLPKKESGSFENILDLKAKIHDRENLVRNGRLMQDLVHSKSIQGLTRCQTATQGLKIENYNNIMGYENVSKRSISNKNQQTDSVVQPLNMI